MTVISFAPGLIPVLRKNVDRIVESDYADVTKHGTHEQSDHGNWARDVAEPPRAQVFEAWSRLTNNIDPADAGSFERLTSGGVIKAHVVKAVSGRMTSTTEELIDTVYNYAFQGGDKQFWAEARGALSTASPEERAVIDGYPAVGVSDTGSVKLLGEPMIESHIKYGRPFARVNTPEADTLIREAAVSAIVAQWAAGSNDTPASLAVQNTAKRVFGLDGAADWNSRKNWSASTPFKVDMLTDGQTSRKVLEDYVKAVYDETQAVWKKEGIKSVTLYRGIHDSNGSIRDRPGMGRSDSGVNMDVTMRPLTSWAYSRTGAMDFAGEIGVVFKAVVPIENVWSTALTGAGCFLEDEFVIFGGTIPTVAYNQGNIKAVERMIADDELLYKANKGEPFNIDENPIDADWIKTLSWDLPTTQEGMEALFGPDWFSYMENRPAWLAAPESLKVGSVAKHGIHDQSDHGNWARDTTEPDPQQIRDAWTELSELASPNTFGFEARKIKAFVAEAVANRMTSSVAEIVEVAYSPDVRKGDRQDEALINGRAALSTASPEVRALSPRLSHVSTDSHGRLEWTYGSRPRFGAVPVHTPEADAMIKRAAVSVMISEWAIGSNDTNLGLAIQDTAKRVFDLPDASEWFDAFTTNEPQDGIRRLADGEVSRKVLEDYVSATYETTQAMWKKMGIKSVALYRGIDDTRDQFKSRHDMKANGIMRLPVKMRPITSWAFTEKGAQMFAGSRGVLFKAVVPIENVWSTALTGAGCHNEDEFIVLGGNIPTVAVQMSPKIDSNGGYTPHVDWDTVNKAKAVAFNIDASPMDANWIKTLSWDLPDTADEMEAFLGPDWRSIMEPLPAWFAAPESLKTGVVAKHGIHEQKSHGNWAHGKGTGSHAGVAKIGPASATDGYGKARGTTYISGNRGETQTPLPKGWLRATEQEHDDYDRANMRALLPAHLLEGLEAGSPLEDNYLRSYKGTATAKVQLFAGPNGTGVVVQGQISWRDDFTPEDFVQNLKQLGELQRVTPAPGLQVFVGNQAFFKYNLDEGVVGFVDTRDNDTMYLRPRALSEGDKYAVTRKWDNVMSVPARDRPMYALTHEYGHVVDRRSDESALADFNEVVQSNRGLADGSSRYAREGYFGEGVGGLQVGEKPTGREMYAEAWAGWVLSKGFKAKERGMVQFFAERYGWDSKTGTAPMAKAKGRGRIYVDTFGPEGGYVLYSLPNKSATVAFAPGLKPVLKHSEHDQSDHGNWAGGGEKTSSPVVNEFTDNEGNLVKPVGMVNSDHPDEELTVTPARANLRDGLNVVSIYKGGERAGVMLYSPYSGKVESINVEERFRRQGVATRLWEAGKYVAARHPNMIEPKHSQSQTTEGAAWASVVKFYGSLAPVKKHGTHDQLTHGRRYGTAVSGGLTASIAERVREYGGLSVNVFDGTQPKTGFMVARGRGKGAIVTAEEFYDPEKGPEILTDFLIKYRSDLTRGAYLGLWHNKKDGNMYLDVSDQIAEQGQAEKLGGPKFRDQISIWDVVAGEEIQTGGSGKLKKGVRDGRAGFAGRSVAESIDGYGRRDSGLREGVVGQVRGGVSICFAPGLVPVFKHGAGDQSPHGNWARDSSAQVARRETRGNVDYLMREGGWLDEQLARDGMAMPPPPGVLDYIAKAAGKIEDWVDRRLNPPLESLPKSEIAQIVMANRARVDASRASKGLPPPQWPEWDGGSVEKADADVVDILRRLFAGEVDDRLFQLMKRDKRPLAERDGPFADLLDVMLNAVARVAGDEGVAKHSEHDQSDHGNWARGGGGKFASITVEEATVNMVSLTTAIDVWEQFPPYDDQYAEGSAGKGKKGEVKEMRSVMNYRGSDLKPEQVDPARMDELIKQGGVEVFRGSTERSHQSVRDGEKKFLTGQWGTGLYTTTSTAVGDKYSVSSEGKGSVLRMVLKPGAKVAVMDEQGPRNGISGSSMDGPMAKVLAPAIKQALSALAARKPAGERDPYANPRWPVRHRSVERMDVLLSGDNGLAAAFAGYDAVKIPFRGEGLNEDWYLILDPAKTAVERVPSVESA